MTHDSDIVEDIFSRVKEILGDKFNGEIIVKLENEEEKIRQSWGGERPYISSTKSKRQKKNKKVLRDLNEGRPIEEVVSNNGISRAAVYRLLKRK